ncbi:MAG: Holliday junction resolvase RuvX [Nitriliruptorales bacterium]|nr:Holliday junction resolvase RuvX [Nitriliruptorales bacterium]
MSDDDLPAAGRLIGVDLGDVRIGLAISDDGQAVATPSDTLEVADALGAPLSDDGRGSADTTDEELARLADTIVAHGEGRGAVGYVIGYPRRLDGREGSAARRARRLCEILQDRKDRPATLWDERLSSVEAERTMLAQDASRRERREATDRVAATLILQGYLDGRRS